MPQTIAFRSTPAQVGRISVLELPRCSPAPVWLFAILVLASATRVQAGDPARQRSRHSHLVGWGLARARQRLPEAQTRCPTWRNSPRKDGWWTPNQSRPQNYFDQGRPRGTDAHWLRCQPDRRVFQTPALQPFLPRLTRFLERLHGSLSEARHNATIMVTGKPGLGPGRTQDSRPKKKGKNAEPDL